MVLQLASGKEPKQSVRFHKVAEGFVEKVDRWEESKDWADIIVFDDCEFGALADRLRAEGKAVLGGTVRAETGSQRRCAQIQTAVPTIRPSMRAQTIS